METPNVSGGWCLGGEAPILVNDGFFELFWTRVRFPPPPLKENLGKEKCQQKDSLWTGKVKDFTLEAL